MVFDVTDAARRTRSPEQSIRDAQFSGRVKGEAHDAVGDYASDRRDNIVVVEFLKELTEGCQAVVAGGDEEGRGVPSGVGIGGREAIGDGLETEGRREAI